MLNTAKNLHTPNVSRTTRQIHQARTHEFWGVQQYSSRKSIDVPMGKIMTNLDNDHDRDLIIIDNASYNLSARSTLFLKGGGDESTV